MKTSLALAATLPALHVPALSLAEAQELAQKNGQSVVPTWCGMCGPAANCGIYAFVENGRFVRVAGMKEAPQNKGGLCCKAHAAPEWVYSTDRIQHPLRRTGKRGENRFEPISWADALYEIAAKLTEQKQVYGPESLAILSPARRDYSEYLYRFLMVHGSPNYAHSGICAMQLNFALSYTLGTRPSPDYSQADLILVWGRQPVLSGPPLGGSENLLKAQARGAAIYTIKPSMEADSIFATAWLPVRPGTDAALALAMLHVVVGEGLIDQNFVSKWCSGYDRLIPHVQQYSPQWAERICGVPAQQITDLARLYARTPRACIDYGNGLEHATSASDAIRAIGILMAITGHLDRPGCNLFPAVLSDMPRPKPVHLRERYTQEWVDKLVAPEFPKIFQPFLEGTSSSYSGIFDDVLSPKPTIRTIIAPGTQPSVSTRNPRGVLAALEKVDFYVVMDTHRTADMAWADIVLPALTPYEISHPFLIRDPLLMARNKVIEPVTTGRSMQQIILDLGVAMGYGDDFWKGDMVACQNDLLSPFNLTLADLAAKPTGIIYQPIARTYENYERVFKSRSGRLDRAPYLPQGKVALYQDDFEAAGFSPLPRFVECPEGLTATPELTEKFPLILSDYHTSISYSAAWLRNIPTLRDIEPHPQLHIHPTTAQGRSISEGDHVTITSPHGKLVARAHLYPGIRPDTVMLLHGWWQGCFERNLPDTPLLDNGSNVNLLYNPDRSQTADPLITALASQTLVEVRRLNVRQV